MEFERDREARDRRTSASCQHAKDSWRLVVTRLAIVVSLMAAVRR